MQKVFADTLSDKMKRLVQESVSKLSECYDAETGTCSYSIYDKKYPADRPSLYYALGLMLLDTEDCVEQTCRICHTVISNQFNAPNEIYHGAYRQSFRPVPPADAMDYSSLGLYGRYFIDLFYEKTMNAFRLNLENDPVWKDEAATIEQLLGKSVLETFPVVYAGYEPCSREFNLMCFSMLLEHFDGKLPESTVREIEKSCELAVQGAIIRSLTDYSPMNTNILTMHIFVTDYFGRRLNHPEWCQYALTLAEKTWSDYAQLHAAREFNSPTYCGVDLSTLGFWRLYGSNPRLKELGSLLEDGIWRDMAEFYNPSLRNFCGPYSRAYELDMNIHTAFPTLLYLLLDDEPYPPFSNESPSNTLLAFGDLHIAGDVKARFTTPFERKTFCRRFYELSERGEPGNREALCTATGWMTPDFMVGALSGSENPSYQLHPLVVFWRGPEGLGTVKLLRRNPDGQMRHLHTVLFNGKACDGQVSMDVDFNVNRNVELFFEIEYPDIDRLASVSPNEWSLPGLKILLEADAPEPRTETEKNKLRVCYLSEALRPETKHMRFQIHFRRSEI